MEKKSWMKGAKLRGAATVTGAISAIIAAGTIFDWRAALWVLAAELAACVAYSLRKLLKKGVGDAF